MMKTEKNLGQYGYAHRRKFQRETFQMRRTLLCSVTDLTIYQDKREAPDGGWNCVNGRSCLLETRRFSHSTSEWRDVRCSCIKTLYSDVTYTFHKMQFPPFRWPCCFTIYAN